MSLFNEASLYITPNGVKAGKLYAVKPTDGSGDLTVTRATSATRVNASGVIETVGANVPRLDYTNGTCPSILVEPQRTNLALYSQEFENASWLKVNSVTVNANDTTAPDGTNTADKISSMNNSSVIRQVINITAGQTYTFSCYIKKSIGTSNTVLRIEDQIAPYNNTKIDVTATNEWHRYSVTRTAGAGVSQITIDIFPDNILNGSIFVWGAQLEEGSYSTSYIPTTSASVTRNADVISKTGISSLIGQTEGVMYFDLKSIANNDFKRLSINGGSYVNSIFFDFDNMNSLYAKVFNGGSTVATLIASGINIANRNKIAIAYKNNDFSFYVNGTQVASQSSGSIPSGLANYEFSLANNQIFEGNINTAALWKTRLTNSQLAELTTI